MKENKSIAWSKTAHSQSVSYVLRAGQFCDFVTIPTLDRSEIAKMLKLVHSAHWKNINTSGGFSRSWQFSRTHCPLA
jgi:hypothetical protein